MHDWCLGDLPGLTTIGGVKDAGRFASGTEPDVGLALRGDACAAGGKSSFALER